MTRLVRGLAVVALVGGAVGACSSDGPGLPVASPSSPPSSSTADPSTELFGKLRAAAKTVRTLHFEAEMSSTDVNGGPGDQLYVTGSGDAMFSGDRISRLRMTVEVNEKRGEVITDDTGIYLRSSDSNAPGGRPWVRYKQSLPTRYLQLFVGFGVLVGPVSPQFAVALRPGATDVRKRLETTEEGVRVTPYVMDLDPAKVSKAASILQKFGSAGGYFSGSLRLSGEGRLVGLGVNGVNGGARLNLGIAYSKYDSPVTITAPPASQVAG